MKPTKSNAVHTTYRVHYYDNNPTFTEDMINGALPEDLQFPPEPPPARYFYDDNSWEDVIVDCTDYNYPTVPKTPGELLRCARDKHPELVNAQQFFDFKRKELRWLMEQPIFRTAKYWCKRIWTKES